MPSRKNRPGKCGTESPSRTKEADEATALAECTKVNERGEAYWPGYLIAAAKRLETKGLLKRCHSPSAFILARS
jgi:hypothetical protein